MAEQRNLPPDAPTPEQLTAFVQELGPCTRAKPTLTKLGGGFNHINYMCEGGPAELRRDGEVELLPERIVLRCAQRPNAAADYAMQREHAMLRFLDDRLAPGTVPKSYDCHQSRIFGGHVVLLEEFVEGKVKTNMNSLTLDETKALARAVSSLHTITDARFSSQPGGQADSCGNYATYIRALLYRSVHMRLHALGMEAHEVAGGLLVRGIKKLGGMLTAPELNAKSSTYTVVHGDLNPRNFVIRPDGSVTLIDAESIRYGDPANDNAYLFVNNGWKKKYKHPYYGDYRAPAACGDVVRRGAVYDLLNSLDDIVWVIKESRENPGQAKWRKEYNKRHVTLERLVA